MPDANTHPLPPLQRDALREALHSPTHSLVRVRGGYAANRGRTTTSGAKTVRLFTGRLLNMLERDGLVAYDEPNWPNTATLTAEGLALAQQLQAAALEKAGAA